MVRTLYTAYTGMKNEQYRLDIISNNLANVSTAGYKEESVANQSFDDVMAIKIRDVSEAWSDRPVGKMSLGVKLGEVYTDYKQGSVRETGNTFNLALEGKGFFALRVVNQNGEESIKYTRDGNFRMTNDGLIVDAYGNNLQSESGNLQIPTEATEVSISPDGTVRADGVVIDNIVVRDFADYDYLNKYGDNMYETIEGAEEQETSALIMQGFIEQSNVNSVREMVEMINITRAYEANQKVIQTTDSMLEQVTTSVGRVG